MSSFIRKIHMSMEKMNEEGVAALRASMETLRISSENVLRMADNMEENEKTHNFRNEKRSKDSGVCNA